MEITYFFDTYALIEVLQGNPNYYVYGAGINVVITRLNLIELHYAMIRLRGRQEADKIFKRFTSCLVDFNDGVIIEANQFRFNRKKQDLSFVDCIGYISSKYLGMKFLTGDKEFKELSNVEFVQ